MVTRGEFVHLLEPGLRRAMGNYWGWGGVPERRTKWYDYWSMTLAEKAAAKLMGCDCADYDFNLEVWRCSCGTVHRQKELPEVLEWRYFHACPSNG